MKSWRELQPSDRVVSASQMRALEMNADASGVTLESLMDAAGEAVFSYICEEYPLSTHTRVAVLCGNGNNGGDGFVIARLLVTVGYRVRVVLINGEPREGGLAAKKWQAWRDVAGEDAAGILPTEEDLFETFWQRENFDESTLVVDAVYGIGFHGSLPAHVARLFARLNALSPMVVAVDLPSGLEADCHRTDHDMLIASATVTFTAPKPSLMMATTERICGRVVVASVGIPEEMLVPFIMRFEEITCDKAASAMIPRDAFGHKGTFGQLLAVCGSYGMAGAAMLAGKAALRCGIGLLHMAIPESIYPIVAGQLWEAVYHPMASAEAEKLTEWAAPCTAVLVGCGLSQHPSVQTMLSDWLPTVDKPLVLDADGLNFLAAHKDIRKDYSVPWILTPHPKEAARLLDTTVEAIERDRIAAVKRLAEEYRAVAVLKGQGTLVASYNSDVVYINTSGCSGMATGGSGDVLAGMIASFVAGGMAPVDAAVVGVHLHGLAGDVTAAELGNAAMLPADMIERLPKVLSPLER